MAQGNEMSAALWVTAAYFALIVVPPCLVAEHFNARRYWPFERQGKARRSTQSLLIEPKEMP
jgi:hypothetical protein